MDMECETSGTLVPLEGRESEHVTLVAPRLNEERSIVSARQTDRARADDLEALAAQISSARQLVKGRACDRLNAIAQQMEQLHVAAKKVLEDAARDEELHSVACNMQKQPGRVYHLYRRNDGYRYFSLLAPQEWNNEMKESEYVASYRLEYDRSWTAMKDVEERDARFARFDNILQNGPAMLSWGGGSK